MLNLGDINFGLGVDTNRLQKAAVDISRFGFAVERAAKATGEGARKIEADMRRQEKALTGALQQVLNLNNAARKAGAPVQITNTTTAAYKKLTDQLAQGRISTLAYQRAMEQFQATMGRSRRALSNFKKTMDDGAAGDRFIAMLRNISSTSTFMFGPLSGAASRIQALTAVASRSSFVLAGVAAGLAGGSLALYKLSTAAVRTGREMEKLNRRFTITSMGRASEEFERIRQLAENAGTEFISTANAYTRMQAAARGTALEGGVGKIFEDLIMGSANFQLTVDELDGAMKAFEQMMSKGTVQAEELRGQLGDRLVGAFNIAAEALGVTTVELNKMLKAGEVVAEDFLPLFAEAFRRATGAEHVERIDNIQASLNRLTNAQNFFNKALDETFGISRAYKAAVDGLTATLSFFTDNMGEAAAAAAILTGAMVGLVAPSVIAGLASIVVLVGRLNKAMMALSATFMTSPIGGMATVLLRIGAAAAGALTAFALLRSDADSASESMDNMKNSINEFIQANKAAAADARSTALANMAWAEGQIASLEAQATAVQTTIQSMKDSIAGMDQSDPWVSAYLQVDIPAEEAKLKAIMEQIWGFKNQQSEIQKILDYIEAQKKKQHDAELRRLAETTRSARRTVSEVLQQVYAYNQLGGSLESVTARAQRTEAIAKFREDLIEAGASIPEVIDLTNEYAHALEKLALAEAHAAEMSAVKDYNRVRAQIEALASGGTAALERLNEEFSQLDAVQNVFDSLIKAGVPLDKASAAAFKYGQALAQLAEDEKAAKIAEDLKALSNTVTEFNMELSALQKGAAFYDLFNDSRSSVSTILEYRDGLVKAGLSTDEVNSKTRALIQTLNALEREKAGQALAKTFEEADKELENLRKRIEATKEGPEALKKLERSLEIDREVARFEKDLREAAAYSKILEDAFMLPEGIETAKTGATDLFGILTQISTLGGMDQPAIALSTALDDAILKAASLQGLLQGIGSLSMGGLAGGLMGGFMGGMQAFPTDTQSVQDMVWNFFIGKGLKPHQVAGIMGNVNAESGFDPYARGDGGNAYGLFQWNDRSPEMLKFIGGLGNLGNVMAQLEFAWMEMLTSERTSFERLKQATTVEEATAAFVGFERPLGYTDANPTNSHGWSRRLGSAYTAANTYGSDFNMGTIGTLPGVNMGMGFNIGTIPADFEAGSLIPEDEVIRRGEEYRKLLIELGIVEDAYEQSKKDEDKAEALAEADMTIERLEKEIATFQNGAAAMDKLQRGFDIADKVKAFEKSLIDAGVAQEIVNEKVKEFHRLLEKREALEQAQNAMMQFAEVISEQYDALTAGMADAMATALRGGGDAMDKLANLADTIAQRMLSSFLELYVLKPLFEWLFGGTSGNGLGMGGGGLFGALIGGIIPDVGMISFSAKGNVFPGSKGLHQFADSIVSQPTLFAFAKGAGPNLGMMGEVPGESEAILPLVRASSGHLGVRAVGAGAGMGGNGRMLENLNIHITASMDESGQLYVRQIASEEAEAVGARVDAGVRGQIAQYNANPWKRMRTK